MNELPSFKDPSEALAYWLNKKGVTAYQLSKDTLLAPSRISEIVAGRRRITTETATVLGAYFGIGPDYWLAVQSQHDLHEAAKQGAHPTESDGHLRIGQWAIRCFVLSDERRLIGASDFFGLFGLNPATISPGRLAGLIDSPYLKSEKMEKLRKSVMRPLKIVDKTGGVHLAYEGEIVVQFCRAILDVRRQDGLPRWAAKLANMCEIILGSVANVGIIALIDEATGHQARRHKEALQILLDAFFRQELAAWSKRFPDWFYEEIFRLNGWKWDSLSTKRPPYVGKLTKDIVYARLEPGVLTQLESLNPVQGNGRRRAKHHQWLSDAVGHPALDAHFYALRGMMRMHTAWDKFHHNLDLAFPIKNKAVQLELDDFRETDKSDPNAPWR